ncbi:helix-turn-helix domain-containing protein [Streptomyces sp. BE20]|uniref:helix-turn-helix domain-containing protein n=1 Tax=Streptomyces sp. BE20 TaxID=3002525 RepID=UPI002E7733DB|nr:helix-turn-helix domain-containing protein [Streptomyces sp. BE20]MEE1823869.1 helix-turn-helix domain-containing protein [Streptomyces sp. BE20]
MTTARQVASGAPDQKEQFQALLVRCRLAVEAGPPEAAITTRGRRRTGLSQERTASMLGVSVRSYGDFERGLIRREPEFLDRVASVLHMSAHERHVMFLLSTGQEPPQPFTRQLDSVPAYQLALDSSVLPGYLSNHCWDIELTNQAFREVWAGRELPTNVLRYILMSEEAREEVLLDWETGWALPFLRQQRAAMNTAPWAQGLIELQRELEDTARSDKRLRKLMKRSTDDEYVHPNGDTRLINHPKWGPTRITLLMTRPLDAASAYRFVWLVPPKPVDEMP